MAGVLISSPDHPSAWLHAPTEADARRIVDFIHEVADVRLTIRPLAGEPARVEP